MQIERNREWRFGRRNSAFSKENTAAYTKRLQMDVRNPLHTSKGFVLQNSILTTSASFHIASTRALLKQGLPLQVKY